MGVAASGFLVMIATVAILVTVIGAIFGVIIWACRFRPFLALAAVFAGYLAVSFPFGWILIGVIYGLPILALAFLSAWLTADFLNRLYGLRALACAPIAVIAGLMLGMLHVLMLRWHLLAPLLSASAGVVLCVRSMVAAKREPASSGAISSR